MDSKLKFCEHCEHWLDYRGFERHEQACAKLAQYPVGWLEREYAKGRSTTNIGRQVGVAQQTVSNWLEGLGIEIRPRGNGGVPHKRRRKARLAARELAQVQTGGGCERCKWPGECDANGEEPLPCEAPLVRAQLDGDDFSELEYWIMRGWVVTPRNGSGKNENGTN